ncbi:hypothetical protein MSAN_01321600 [Mycena sanguinolenta]|uniref:Ubiquitin-like domain-containing protein n=1 Tax=Mycena sanguinolenta TaxID=230812 RepID=A0A8H7D0C3_9AGAR|nr:hypothetical protein MSAN_01321600 [Mycena sanguinolenta]
MVKIYVVNRTSNEPVPGWVQYDVDVAEPVRKLKADIHESEGLTPGQQCLKYEDIELRDEQTLQSYTLREGCTVDVFRNEIRVEFPGLALSWEVDLDTPLSDLRDIISKQVDLNEDCATVKFKEQMLRWDDKRTLSSLGIHHCDLVSHIGPYSFKDMSEWSLSEKGSPAFSPSSSGPDADALKHKKALHDWDGGDEAPSHCGIASP